MEAADEERHLLDHLPPQDGDSQYTCDGSVDINKQPALKQSTGNWRACFFILGIEFSECISFFAISKNLVTYLTSVLHESNVDAARNVSTWIGSTYFTPLIGAFIADTYWGKYWTIVVFLSVYAVGMLVLTVSTSLPSLLQSPNYSGIHSVVVYMGLYLIALGNGGIKPCTPAFGADQFDIADSVERVKKGSFFNWFYFWISVGSLLSTTVLVWVQDNVGWGIGFAIPMVLMSLGFAVFVAGRRVYRYKKLGESPMTRVSRVVVAAVRNYHLKLPDDSSALHELRLSVSQFTARCATRDPRPARSCLAASVLECFTRHQTPAPSAVRPSPSPAASAPAPEYRAVTPYRGAAPPPSLRPPAVPRRALAPSVACGVLPHRAATLPRRAASPPAACSHRPTLPRGATPPASSGACFPGPRLLA